MIILIIQVNDVYFLLVDGKGDPPVFGDVQGPCPFAFACKLVRFPDRQCSQFFLDNHVREEGQNDANLWESIGWQAGAAAGLDQPPQPFMTYASAPAQANAYAMIRRRAAAAEIDTKIGNHTFRATRITVYLKKRRHPGESGRDGEPCQHAHHATLRP
jgi:hypothetical protein